MYLALIAAKIVKMASIFNFNDFAIGNTLMNKPTLLHLINQSYAVSKIYRQSSKLLMAIENK